MANTTVIAPQRPRSSSPKQSLGQDHRAMHRFGKVSIRFLLWRWRETHGRLGTPCQLHHSDPWKIAFSGCYGSRTWTSFFAVGQILSQKHETSAHSDEPIAPPETHLRTPPTDLAGGPPVKALRNRTNRWRAPGRQSPQERQVWLLKGGKNKT